MRRRIAIWIAVPALLGAVALAGAANGKGRPEKVTLQARSQLEQIRVIDNAPSGRSAGDMLIFTEKLIDRDGNEIGHDAATCTSLFDKRSLCTGTYILQGGQIMVQLLQPSLTGALNYTQPITGGTGRYARATGTVTVRQRPTGDRFTFRIRLP
jgi:hypothetical protein